MIVFFFVCVCVCVCVIFSWERSGISLVLQVLDTNSYEKVTQIKAVLNDANEKANKGLLRDNGG